MSIDILTYAFIYAILGFGVFLSFRILNITDLTVEASYGFGGVLSAMLASKGLPFTGLLIAFLGGGVAGLITALLHTKLKINAILSGILTLTAFYSVNLIVAGKNTTLALDTTVFFQANDYVKMVIMLLIALFVGVAFALFFRTKLGLSIRACGDNEQMAKTQCISTDLMKIIGLSLSNALVALSGALFVQCQGAYFTKIESGMMVVGVATIIIGEIIIFRRHSIDLILIGIVAGSIIYRLVYALALKIPFFRPRDLQLVQTLFLVIILVGSIIADAVKKKRNMANVYVRLQNEEANHDAVR